MAAAGRRPGHAATREQILTAARTLFAQHGYTRTTVRAIAAEAGVNPALVHYFFGSKERVFVAALELPATPAEILPALLSGPRDQFGARIAAMATALWRDPATRAPLLALLRSSVESEQAAGMLREFFSAAVIERAAKALGVPRFRLAAAMGQAIGLMLFRYTLAVEPLASADEAQLTEQLAAMIQHTLDRP
jgi:AcrR family transcriptional regulator